MEKKRQIIGLILIVLFGLFLRIYRLDSVPVSVSWDEAAIGYNAYSIVQTGKDEYGTSWPLLFKSFNDYKLPGYIYSTALSVKLLGLNDFAVRLPSALFGAFTVLAFYFLAKELLKRGAFIGTLLFAISPWHLQFSRAAFEANGSLFFVVLGFVLLFVSRRKPHCIIFSFISLTLSLYFYYSARLLVPMLLLVYGILFRKTLQKKWLIAGIIACILLLLPLMPAFVGDNTSRISQVSIFTDEATTNDYVLALARNPEAWWAKLFYNRRIGYLYRFVENYFKNYSLEFLFVRGDPYPRHHVSGMGYLYLWELPFLLIGIVSLFLKRTKEGMFILAWWLLGAVPASFTTGSPHGLRTLTTLPAFILLTTNGIAVSYKWIKNKRLFVISSSLVVLGFFTAYLVYYYDYTPRHVAQSWGDGHKQLFSRLKEIESQYDTVVVTGYHFKPYIYYLYHNTYSPSLYQETGNEGKIGKYLFKKADWEKSVADSIPFGKTLYVRSVPEVNVDVPILEEVKSTFGDTIFVLQEV